MVRWERRRGSVKNYVMEGFNDSWRADRGSLASLPVSKPPPPHAEQNASLTWRYMQSWLTHTHMQWLQRAQGDSGSPPPAYDAFMSYWSYCNSELLKVSCQYASHNYKWDSCDIWYIYIKFHTNVPQSFIVIKPKMKWIWGYEANCLFNQEHYLKGPLGKKAQCIL